ncbi:hypothetical protein KKQ10_15720 [Pseudomonas sp. MG-9]|nr:hypothetical protein [Pseudomonas sp. MG-9]
MNTADYAENTKGADHLIRPRTLLRNSLSSVAANSLSISLADAMDSQALTSSDSVLAPRRDHEQVARLAWQMWGGWGEVMVERAFGGFVEFF